MLDSIRKSEGPVRLVSADYDQSQIFTCTECEQVGGELENIFDSKHHDNPGFIFTAVRRSDV